MSGRRRWTAAYPALLAGIAAQRGLELLLSQRNERRSAEALGTAGARSYPLMVVLHMALFCVPLIERRIRPVRVSPAVVVPALAGVGIATALRLWVIGTLGRNWNVRGRVHRDLEVIDSGPYRYVRHPNYVAVALEMAALPLAGSAPISAFGFSVANALVLVPRVRAEEALLDTIPGYHARMGHKPRFVPRPGWR